MAIYDMHRSTAEPISTRAATAIVDFVIRMIDAWQVRSTKRTLRRLSDHELDDIGLCRADLHNLGR